jgi:hypothetical protein
LYLWPSCRRFGRDIASLQNSRSFSRSITSPSIVQIFYEMPDCKSHARVPTDSSIAMLLATSQASKGSNLQRRRSQYTLPFRNGGLPFRRPLFSVGSLGEELHRGHCLTCSRNASRAPDPGLGCVAAFSNRLPSTQSDTHITYSLSGEANSIALSQLGALLIPAHRSA